MAQFGDPGWMIAGALMAALGWLGAGIALRRAQALARQRAALDAQLQSLEAKLAARPATEQVADGGGALEVRPPGAHHGGDPPVPAPWQLADQWMARVSHELRTPLQAALSWAQIARHAAGDADRTRQAAERLLLSVQAQARVLAELQDCTRILAGLLVPVPVPVDAAQLLGQAAEAVRGAAALRGVTIALSAGPATLPMQTDPARLDQLLRSLLLNAVQASADGGQVLLQHRLEDGVLVVEVIDEGRGIDPRWLPRIFEPLLPQPAGRPAPRGRGVGLALARRLAEALGGALTAHSAGLGQGACFTLRLPLHAGAAGSAPDPAKSPKV